MRRIAVLSSAVLARCMLNTASLRLLDAGASLIQLYTGLIFRGVGLIGAIKTDLLDFMRIGRLDSLADAVGRDAAAVTAEPWPNEVSV